MLAPDPPLQAPARPFAKRRLARAGLALLGAGVLLAADAAAQSRPDQVLYRQRGQSRTYTGTITENTLSKVVVEKDGDERDFDTSDVERVVFGDVPQAYVEGQAYFDRGDYENAAAKFEVAAGDASTRDVVKAVARLKAAQSWMRQGASDPTAFQEALSEIDRFLTDYPDNRDLPQARALHGRASWLAGDPAKAGEIYRALYQEAEGEEPTTGYSYAVCYGAGLAAAEAFLAGGDVDTAREIFDGVTNTLTTLLASLPADDPSHGRLSFLQIQSRLGEGYCLLAAGDNSQAKTFFEGLLNGAGKDTALRFGAKLGLAETLLAADDVRQAQLEFAQVSAIDHTDRDRTARALVGLAECSLRLPDSNGREKARIWLQAVREQYGDTPSVLRALELSQTL